jgi:hypothetical protein
VRSAIFARDWLLPILFDTEGHANGTEKKATATENQANVAICVIDLVRETQRGIARAIKMTN